MATSRLATATKRSRAPERSTPSRGAPTRATSSSASPVAQQAPPLGTELLFVDGTLDVGHALTDAHLLHLQRTAGNRALSAVIQRAPGDPDDPNQTGPGGAPFVSKGATTAMGGGSSYAPVPMPKGGTTAMGGADSHAPIPMPAGGTGGARVTGPSPTSPAPGPQTDPGQGTTPIVAGAPVPAGFAGAVNEGPKRRDLLVANKVPDHVVDSSYRRDPSSVIRSPSSDWHYQMWNFMKGPGWSDEPPPAFRAGKLIAIAPDHQSQATPLPNYSGDDKTGLGKAQPATPAPIDRLPPKPERPMTRAITPGFNPGPQLATRDTAVRATHQEVLDAMARGKVMRSPSTRWHAEAYGLDQGKGNAPKAFRVGDVIIITPKYRVPGVPTPTYGQETGSRFRGDANMVKGPANVIPGVTLDAMKEKEVTQGGTTTRTGRGGTAGFGGGNIATLGGQQTVTETSGDQSKVVKHAANIGLKPDGSLVLGGERTKEKFSGTDDAGNPIKTGGTSMSGNVGFGEKGFTGQVGASKTNQAGNKQSVTGSGTFDPSKGNISGQLGYAYQSKGGASFTPTISAGVEVLASDPIPAEGGGFDVTYTISNSKGAGVGVGKQGKSGGSIGANVGTTNASLQTGTRHFDDEKKAKAFRDNAAKVIAGESYYTLPPTTVAGALMIPIGEERGSGEMSGSTIGGSVAFEGASLGYGRSKSTTQQFKVRRTGAKIVEVTGSVSGTKGSDVTGGGGITLVRGSSETEGFAVTWEFDLDTKLGRDAFERYAKTGLPPIGGAKMKAVTKSGSQEDHDNVSIPLLGTAKWTGTAWEVVRTDSTGRHAQFGGQQAHNQDPSWFGKKLGQDKLASNAQIVSGLTNDQDAGSVAKIEVSGDSGQYNRETLGQIFMGVPHAGSVKASGEWTLTARVNPAVIKELEKNNKEMREAPTKEDKLRVYTNLVKERGIRMVGAQVGLGGDATAWNLELKGDKNFPGPKGRAELDQKRAELRERLKTDPTKARSVAREAQRFLDELAARRNAVKDKKQYTDLPDGLRDEQLKVIDKHISDFELVRHMAAKEAVRLNPGEKVEATQKRTADKDGYRNEQNTAEGADMARLRDQIDGKENAIRSLDPRILRAIDAIQRARSHTVNVPSSYAGWVMAHRADYNMHWNIGIGINDRQMAMAPKADALRMKLLEYISPTERKSTADALLAQLTDRLALLEALHTSVISAATALKPITTERGFAGYPRFWASMKGDEQPWVSGGE